MSENKPVIVALVVTGLALAGFGIYFALDSSDEGSTTSESVPVVAAPPVATIDEIEEVEETTQEVLTPDMPIDSSNAAVEQTPSFVLPRLNDSDQLIRDGAISLTRNEGINVWLGTDELVRKSVVFIDNIANGTIAKEPVAALAPRTPMAVIEVEEGVYVIDERSYERFNSVTNVLLSIDTNRAVEFYVLLKPLFTEAYSELGYPESDFDAVILRSIGRLLETPTLSEPAKLVRPVVMYEYQDGNLEALSPAQKQLLRLGPKHSVQIKNKLRDIARELRAAVE